MSHHSTGGLGPHIPDEEEYDYIVNPDDSVSQRDVGETEIDSAELWDEVESESLPGLSMDRQSTTMTLLDEHEKDGSHAWESASWINVQDEASDTGVSCMFCLQTGKSIANDGAPDTWCQEAWMQHAAPVDKATPNNAFELFKHDSNVAQDFGVKPAGHDCNPVFNMHNNTTNAPTSKRAPYAEADNIIWEVQARVKRRKASQELQDTSPSLHDQLRIWEQADPVFTTLAAANADAEGLIELLRYESMYRPEHCVLRKNEVAFDTQPQLCDACVLMDSYNKISVKVCLRSVGGSGDAVEQLCFADTWESRTS